MTKEIRCHSGLRTVCKKSLLVDLNPTSPNADIKEVTRPKPKKM